MESETSIINMMGTGDGEIDHNQLNQVWLASAAMQQLPKILDALSNMARRSRCQLQRKGVFLGGLWPGKGIDIDDKLNIPEEILGRPNKRKGGILKTSKKQCPTINQISSQNEFWKRFSFTFSNSTERKMRTSRQTCFSQDYLQIHHQNLQGVVYSSQPGIFFEPFDATRSQLPFLQKILSLDQCKCSSLSQKEQEILKQLQHLRVMFNVPLHKLLRERPKEYVLPLPRRSKRSLLCSTNPHTRSLVFHQTVRILPSMDDLQTNRWFTKKVRFFGPMISAPSGLSKWNRGRLSYTRTVPKGVAFLTYPDTSGDETSFEGTIGERSMISWERGTKFPQMGIDQSPDFRCKKELSRQTMIQSRLYAARLHRRMTHRYRQHLMGGVNHNHQTPLDLNLSLENNQRRSSFICVPKNTVKRKKPTRIAKSGVRRTVAGHPIFRSWFKFVKFPRRSSFIRRDNIVGDSSASVTNVPPPAEEETVRCPEADDAAMRLQQRRRQAQRQERRKRLRIYLIKIIGFMSCGLLPYIMTGECYVFKRKTRVRIADSTERIGSPAPSTSTSTTTSQLK